jgi:hypothetical protein
MDSWCGTKQSNFSDDDRGRQEENDAKGIVDSSIDLSEFGLFDVFGRKLHLQDMTRRCQAIL